jgi:hypothetical protein
MGAGGFVGNAIATRLERDDLPVLRPRHWPRAVTPKCCAITWSWLRRW